MGLGISAMGVARIERTFRMGRFYRRNPFNRINPGSDKDARFENYQKQSGRFIKRISRMTRRKIVRTW
jgi:hypothetical protein